MAVNTGRKYPYKTSRVVPVPFTANYRGMLCSMYRRLEELERHHELAMRNSTAGILALVKIGKIEINPSSGYWEEIEEARRIADEALATMGLSLNQEVTLEIDDERQA